MEHYERIKEIKDRYTEQLMAKKNVVGVGIGFAERGGSRTDELALLVMVDQKRPAESLDAQDIIPAEIEGVPVDVQAVGDIRAFS